MNRRHARYPFLEAAREAVGRADVALPELVARDAPAVQRGRQRVERALLEGTVESAEAGRWDARAELLSYPIARVLVSLIDSPAAVEKYAAAEATTAGRRLREDLDAGQNRLRSTDTERIDLPEFLREMDLANAVSPEAGSGGRGTGTGGGRQTGTGDGRQTGTGGGQGQTRGSAAQWFRVDVVVYLRLKGDWGDRWRLVNRELVAGEVRLERAELFRLVEAAVERRVAEGLPFDVAAGEGGETIVESLAPTVEELRDLLGGRAEIGEIDAVVPELFPPCMSRLLERANRGVELAPYESFSLMAFLTGIGMSADEIVAFCRASSLEEDGIRYQTEYLRDDGGTQYPPPSCETLHAYGLCENDEDHWEVAGHPLVYYQRRLDEADGEELTDWRERDEKDDQERERDDPEERETGTGQS